MTGSSTQVRLGALLVATGALAGCGATGPAPEDAGRDGGGEATTLEIGTRGDGATFTPWGDGDSIPLMWGPQGGVMITPSVAIDGRLVTATDPALDVSIENLDPSTGARWTDFPGYGPVRAVFARLDQRLVNGPIFDQLGWSDQTGRRVRLRVHVTGMGVDASRDLEIVLSSAGAMPPPPDCSDAMPCFDGRGLDGAQPDAGL